MERHDTVVIGGGQAGLVMSYHLRQRNREHVILERRRIAERWRTERWDSLHFQLPNRWLELPGKPYRGPQPDGFAHHTEVTDFILDYASEIAAPVRTGVEVTCLRGNGDRGGYLLETSDGLLGADHVVIATGPFQRPAVPDFARKIPGTVFQASTSEYRNPADLPAGAVLIVGSGNSGCQIADELLRADRRVFLSVSRHTRVPRRYRGQDIIWWYEELGRFDVPIDTFPNRRYPPTTLMTGIDGGYDIDPQRLGLAGATLVGRVVGAEGGKLALAGDVAGLLAAAERAYLAFLEAADGLSETPAMAALVGGKEPPTTLPPVHIPDLDTLDLAAEGITTIIWANGFLYDYNWVALPILDGDGVPAQNRGVTACPGVFFLGLHWMHTFRSGILTFVGRDAAHIADQMDLLPH